MKMPDEVSIAKKFYDDAYNKIKGKVVENRKKYIGTKYEDCPPLIKEQGQFFVRRADVLAAKERLTKEYGKHPSTWDYWIAYYEKNSSKKETLPMEGKTKKRGKGVI